MEITNKLASEIVQAVDDSNLKFIRNDRDQCSVTFEVDPILKYKVQEYLRNHYKPKPLNDVLVTKSYIDRIILYFQTEADYEIFIRIILYFQTEADYEIFIRTYEFNKRYNERTRK
jgi:hypothetical protein